MMVKPARGHEPLLRRPFSIFEVLRDGHGTPAGVSLLNKRVGVGTELIYHLEAGDRDRLPRPARTAVHRRGTSRRSLDGGRRRGSRAVRDARGASAALGTVMTLFYGGRAASDLYYLPFFEERGVQLVLTTEDGSVGEQGYITEPLERALAAGVATPAVTLYVCGPTPMMRAVARLAARHNRPAQVSLEQVMGCGLGGCYSCVVPVRESGRPPHFVRSCIEGPVFSSESIAWELLEHG